MEQSTKKRRFGNYAVTLAAVVIILAGLKVSAAFVVPFLLAGFIALLCVTPQFWLQKKGVPDTLAVLIVLLGVCALGSILVVTVGSSLRSFSSQLPFYQERLAQETEAVFAFLATNGVEVAEHRAAITELFSPSAAMRVAGSMLTSAGGVLTNSFMIILTVIFILFEAATIPGKLAAAVSNPESTFASARKFIDAVNRYLFIKTAVSLITGVLVTVWLAIVGVDFPVLWGVLAFALNYVPNIGSIIAAVPAVLLAFVQFGISPALLSVVICYVVINVGIGSVVEPKFMGRGLGLSTLVVFLSLVFWGWLLGPVGMLLSVVLTMIVKIALESSQRTKSIAIMLGPGLSPEAPADAEPDGSPQTQTGGGSAGDEETAGEQ